MGKLTILVGDITSDELLIGHDAIVNPTNPRMVCGAGVSGAIFHKAGVDELENYTQSAYNISYFTEDNLMNVGDIRITPGFKLGMDIIFVQGPKKYDYDDNRKAKMVLLDTYKKLIQVAYSKGYKHILCPSLGTGSYCFRHEDIAKDVVSVIKESIKELDLNIDFVLYDASDIIYYE